GAGGCASPGQRGSPGRHESAGWAETGRFAAGQHKCGETGHHAGWRVIDMISSVFVDRPRLAIVIAFVMTIAGLLALTQIPVAQFPDIVPPQVTVTATYPGASASVVEASVGQPLEAQVIGVDKML